MKPRLSDKSFRYQLIAPSIFVLLLIGVFPLVYLLVVSFQGITMIDNVSVNFDWRVNGTSIGIWS